MSKSKKMQTKLTAFTYNPLWPIPCFKECVSLWKEYLMPKHIQKHSLWVGSIAEQIAFLLQKKGWKLKPELFLAAGLLHDLGKHYTIVHGGAHSQLGASLVLNHYFNPALAQGVIHHVFWPGEVDLQKFPLPLIIIYSDKRVKHTQVVSIETRFQDLFKRYGTSKEKRAMIQRSKEQALAIENQLNQILGVDLNAYPFSCRRLV
ncbi:MAG: hypothetical protein PWR24_80 [Desulfonauticus sp.]|jgi:putative nucleotidyltransferase with HDIG domain|nr:MAG: Metal dependent phosphohydrolase [Desulfonauticus sp. 38_4375]MDK2920523.1 hypothetical protein [Desulfonauticus sp.]